MKGEFDRTGRKMIVDSFLKDWTKKFDKGIEEHGTGFMDMSHTENAWEEVLDLVSYMAKVRLDRYQSIFFLETAIQSQDWDLVKDALSIIKNGKIENVK